MANDLEITGIRLGGTGTKMAPGQQGVPQIWYDLTVSVTNHSDKTLYVISEPRTMRYDAASNTLFLGLSEEPPGPELDQVHLRKLLPHVQAIPAGQSVNLELSVPAVIKRLAPPGSGPDLSLRVEDIDISSLESIRCKIGFSETPLKPRAAAPGQHMSHWLQSWQRTVEKTVRVQ